jgi:hypothetical protein
MLSQMLGQHTLGRMKKREHIRTTEKKSKVDKKDDITIVFFFLFYFSDYIVRPSTIKKTSSSGLLRFSIFSGGKKVPDIKKRNWSL